MLSLTPRGVCLTWEPSDILTSRLDLFILETFLERRDFLRASRVSSSSHGWRRLSRSVTSLTEASSSRTSVIMLLKRSARTSTVDVGSVGLPISRPPLHSKTKVKVLGKIKNECRSFAPQEFVGLRAIMCSIFLSNGKPKFTAKDVSYRYILKHLHHKYYLRMLKGTESTIATFSTLRSLKQQIKTLQVTKNLSAPLTTNNTSLTTEYRP